MPPPNDLLKALARAEPVAARDVTPATVELALEHRMAPLLLSAVGVEDLEPRVAAPLIAYDMGVKARRRLQGDVLDLLSGMLADAGIVHTVIKGVTSATRWFKEPTERPFSDIDVVVPMGDEFQKAILVLQELSSRSPLLDRKGMIEAMSSMEMVIDSVRVDLQTEALRTGLVPNDYESWSVGALHFQDGPAWRIMDTEHDMVVFLLHQGRDRFRFLLGVAEARMRLQHPIDWSKVEHLARVEGIWEQVAVSLEVMCDELGIGLPIDMPRGWRMRLWRHLWRPKIRHLGDLGRVRHVFRGKWLMPLTMKGRSLDAIRWMFESALPPEAVLRLKYPNARGPYLWKVLATRARVILRRRWRVMRHRLRTDDRGDRL